MQIIFCIVWSWHYRNSLVIIIIIMVIINVYSAYSWLCNWQTQSQQVIKNILTLREDVIGMSRDKTTVKTSLTIAMTLTSTMTDITITHTDTCTPSTQSTAMSYSSKHISQQVFQHYWCISLLQFHLSHMAVHHFTITAWIFSYSLSISFWT